MNFYNITTPGLIIQGAQGMYIGCEPPLPQKKLF